MTKDELIEMYGDRAYSEGVRIAVFEAKHDPEFSQETATACQELLQLGYHKRMAAKPEESDA